MFKQLATAAIGLAFLSLGACASMGGTGPGGSYDISKMEVRQAPHDEEHHAPAVGGDYYVVWYPGLPGRREHAVFPTAHDLDDMDSIHEVCVAQLRHQQPNTVKSVGFSAGEGATSGALSLMAEGLAAGIQDVSTLGKEGGAGGLISGTVNGFDSHRRARHIEIGGECMPNLVNDAVRAGDYPAGIHPIANMDSVNGQKIFSPYDDQHPRGEPIPAPSQRDDQLPANQPR